jgi:hypothetical protein
MGRHQIDNDKQIISDIRFDPLKEDKLYPHFEHLINPPHLSPGEEFKKALSLKLSAIFFYSDILLSETKASPIVNYTLPFSEFPKTEFENDIIKNLFEDICIAFRSSLDILTHLLSIQIKSLPQLPGNPNGELDPNGKYEGFKRSSKLKVDTLKILKKDAPALYAIFQKHNDWINQLCDYRDIIIHKKGYLDISYWTKIQEKQSITWITPMLDNGESIELFTITIRDKIIEFYKEILTEYDNLTPQSNNSVE